MHIGNIIHKVMEQQGHTVTWLAHEYGCSRVNIYKIFDKQSVDTQSLLRLSVILDYDFFALYQQESTVNTSFSIFLRSSYFSGKR